MLLQGAFLLIRTTNMLKLKQIGICMDHASAHLMEMNNNDITSKTIKSTFSHEEKERSLSKSEKLMHNKEQHKQAQYYQELAGEIKKFDHVLLFGPTEAKVELLNYMKENHDFEKIKFEIKNSDKMTKNQQYAFVRVYFS